MKFHPPRLFWLGQLMNAFKAHRVFARGSLRLRYLPCALLAVAESLLQCWTLLALASLPTLILTLSGQGRQALLVGCGNLGFSVFMLGTLMALLVVWHAQVILDMATPVAQPRRSQQYARQVVPPLLATIASFALPLLARYSAKLNLEPVLGFGQSLEFHASPGFLLLTCWQLAGPMMALVVPAMIFNGTKWELQPREIVPLGLVVGVYALTFIFTDTGSVLTRFLILNGAIMLVYWFFPYSYLRANSVRQKRLFGSALVGVCYALFLVCLAVRIAVAPVERAPWWGVMDVCLISVFAWISAGFLFDFLTWLFKKNRCCARNPLLVRAVRWVIVLGVVLRLLTGSFNDSRIPSIAYDTRQPHQTLVSYLDDWLNARQEQAHTDHPYPVFIVTAEGGGIRAAYWTATVLSALQDQKPEFSKHILALSGVSGGSVGTSLFAAAVAPATATNVSAVRDTNTFTTHARRIAGSDLLSAPLTAMLLAEPIHRLTRTLNDADRALALEKSFASVWRQEMHNDHFGEPFAKLATSQMLLLPNSTSASSGERLVITPLDDQGAFAPAQVLDGRSLSLATATFLSARFPGVSPVGVTKDQHGKRLRIVDGGFADNSGAVTANDVLKELISALQRTGFRARFIPVVIAIKNGEVTSGADSEDTFRSLTVGALFDPVITMDTVRATTSKRFEDELRTRIAAENGIYLSGMRLLHRDADLPLGWMLAPTTATIIDQRLIELAANPSSDFQRVCKLLQ